MAILRFIDILLIVLVGAHGVLWLGAHGWGEWSPAAVGVAVVAVLLDRLD